MPKDDSRRHPPSPKNSHSGPLDTRRCSRKHPPSPKKMHSGALDTFGVECQITCAQCVFFTSTHECGCVAVGGVMMIWCIAKDCAEGRAEKAQILSQASTQSQKNHTLVPLTRFELSVKLRAPSACFLLVHMNMCVLLWVNQSSM